MERAAMSEPNTQYWRLFHIERDDGLILTFRPAEMSDRATLEVWDLQPDVIAASSDNRDLAKAFGGLGEMMMWGMIEACFEDANVTAILIDPLNSNTRAHAFYQRLGFKPVGRQVFNDEDDCLVHKLERADWRAQIQGD